MVINEQLILSKLEKYLDSNESQKKQAQYINDVSSGKKSFGRKLAKGKIPTPESMKEAAEYLISAIHQQIVGEYYIDAESVRNIIFEDLQITSRIINAGRTRSGVQLYQLYVGFYSESNLHRYSLRKKNGEYTGRGIDNIVSLFDTGYTASKNVYGFWDKSGDSSVFSDSNYIKSLNHRDGLGFMMEAVSFFNSRYGDEFSCHAEIVANDEYYFRSAAW